MTPDLWINALAAVFAPLLVGLVTTRLTSSWVKVGLLAFLNLVQTVATELAADGVASFDMERFILRLAIALAVAWGAYYNVWKPTGVAEVVQLHGRTPKGDQGQQGRVA